MRLAADDVARSLRGSWHLMTRGAEALPELDLTRDGFWRSFLAFALIKYWLHGDTWVFGWKPVLVTVLFAAWFGRTMYRWMMRLDAQYGRGSGWVLESVRVKLPELRSRLPH